MAHICEHPGCSEPAAETLRFCSSHIETDYQTRLPTTDELNLVLATLEVKCDKCSRLAPEGLLSHRCEAPGPQPDPREM